MEYTIYSYGSGEILEKVFNVLAMLCKTESIFFRPVLMLTATVGGTWSALRAIFGQNPSIFVRDWMLPTVLIFNLMFVPRVTVNIVDNVDTFHHYMRVDHVPVGPALIGHIASNLSYFLTEKIEERLVPAEYANLTYGKTGPMFAANLMMASQDLTISDPILRDNIKSYVDQCYTWPYLYTNIAGKREEALRTPDILGFMRANPHKGLGMYWKGAAGQPTFCKCSQVPEKLSGGMDRECGKALSKIAAQVMPGISVQNPDRARTVISPVAESAWHAIAKDSTTAHKRVEQLMVINAAREAIDDSLEKFGNERRFKRLISYSATRAEQQQNSGFLIAGLTAARQLPLLQGVFLSLLLVSFTVVVAFTFIPGGLKIWGMWIKMIIWVESWPIFFGILNCIGLLWLEKSLATITQTESGITWISQSGLAESSWTAYCIVQNFFLAVPFLSWAIISQSGHALVSMAERALPTLGQALGQNIIDNNQTFDTQSFNNRSMNGTQMAQQNLGANYSLGNTVDDGKFRVTADSSGSQVVQEHMSSTRHSINSNEAIQAQVSQQVSHEKQVLDSLSQSYTNSENMALDKSFELTKSFAQGKAHLQGASESQNKDLQKSAQEILSANERIATQQSISENASWRNSVSVGLKLWGTGPTASGNSEAMNQDMRQFTKDTGINRDVAERMSHGLNAALTNHVNFSEDSSKRTAESYRSSVTSAQNFSDQISTQKSKVDRFQEMGSLMESQGISITQNLNDDVLEYIAAKNNWSKEEAGRWSSNHSAAFREEANSYIQGWTQNMSSWLESKSGPLDSSFIDTLYQTYKKDITSSKNFMVDSSRSVREKAVQEGIGFDRTDASEQGMTDLYEKTSSYVQQSGPDFAAVEEKTADIENDLLETHQGSMKEFDKFKKKNLTRRSGKAGWEKLRPRIWKED